MKSKKVGVLSLLNKCSKKAILVFGIALTFSHVYADNSEQNEIDDEEEENQNEKKSSDNDSKCLPNLIEIYESYEDPREKWDKGKLSFTERVWDVLEPFRRDSERRISVPQGSEEEKAYKALLNDEEIQSSISKIIEVAEEILDLEKKLDEEVSAFKNLKEFFRKTKEYVYEIEEKLKELIGRYDYLWEEEIHKKYPIVAARRGIESWNLGSSRPYIDFEPITNNIESSEGDENDEEGIKIHGNGTEHLSKTEEQITFSDSSSAERWRTRGLLRNKTSRSH